VTILRSADEVAAVIAASECSQGRTIAGIAGAPGAGKSTLAAAVVERLGDGAILLPMDGFHLPQATLTALGRRERMGAPDTFDLAALLNTLTLLTDAHNSGRIVVAPSFNREIEEPVPDAIEILPELCAVVLEGNYLLLDHGGWEAVAGFLDVSFYLDVDGDLRLERLIARHEAFGKSPADARAWALGPDEANARLIQSTAQRADYRVRL
jgi:pantothenate kinase